jgi:hypothetical protein
MNVMALGLALMVSSSGVSPAKEIPRAMVVPAAFTFDLPPTDALGPPWRSTSVLQPSPPRDSLKNGAIIGAIIGAATGACMAAFGCAIVKETGGEIPGEESCAGFSIFLVGAGIGVGAAIGVAVDAMFERNPSAGLPGGGRRTVLRLKFRF